jgi:hypothetical protein
VRITTTIVTIPRPAVAGATWLAGIRCHLQPKEIADLAAGDQHRDAVREANDHRPRNEPDGGAAPRQPEDDENDASHHRAHEKTGYAVLRHDP